MIAFIGLLSIPLIFEIVALIFFKKKKNGKNLVKQKTENFFIENNFLRLKQYYTKEEIETICKINNLQSNIYHLQIEEITKKYFQKDNEYCEDFQAYLFQKKEEIAEVENNIFIKIEKQLLREN